MKRILFAGCMLFLTVASAEVNYSMPALEAGFKWSSMDYEGSSGSDKQDLGIQIGGSVVLNFAQQFGLRTGLFYSERPFKNENAVQNIDGKLTYAEVPVHFMFKLEDYAGIYLGPSIAMKISEDVNVGSLSDVKSMVIPLTLGAQFKFMPNLGVNLFFETVPGRIADNLKDSRGIGANLLIAFD